MDWTQQTNDLMKMWADAQRQMWSGWMQMMPNAAQMGGGMPSMFDPSQLFKMGVDTWSSSGQDTMQRFAGNLMGAPDMMSRSMNLLMKSWQSVAPKLEAGQPWQPDFQKLMDQWRQEMTAIPTRASATANEFTELGKVMFERWTPLTGTWMAMMSQALSGHPGESMLSGSAGLNRMMSFYEGVFPQLASPGDMPRGTVMREKMGRILEAMDSLGDLRKAQAAYHKKLGDGLGLAVERTMDHLAKLAAKGEKIESVRDLMRTWFTIADSTLNEVFISEEFLEVQEMMTNALMTAKVKQRNALEMVYHAMELPTRSEIDEAYKDIHELKREVRMLRRELRNIGSEAPAAKPKRVAAAKKTQQASAPAES